MTRPKTRRALRLETLESRELLSSGGPSAQEQYMLELINMSRTNPAEAAGWIKSHVDANDQATMDHFGVNLDTELSEIAASTPVQPLAWNDTLAQTAQGQSQYEADNQVQTHIGANGSSVDQRLDAAGYTNRVADGENSYAYANSVDHAMKAFLIDWGVNPKGHRGNLLQPNTSDGQTYNEVGIGIVATNPGSSVGPYVMTQDFGRRQNSLPQVVGAVFKDSNGDNFYTPGEGQGGVTVALDNASGQEVARTQTWASGGYQIPVATPGSYTVKILDANGNPVQSKNITVGSDNVLVDYDLNQDAAQAVASSASGSSSSGSGSSSTKGTGSSTTDEVIANLHFDPSWQNAWYSWTQS